MKPKKINTTYERLVIPLLVLFCGLVLTAACTKKNSSMPVAGTIINTFNTDSMPVTGTKTYLALGDSYTIGTSVPETDRYPVQTAAILKAAGIQVDLDIIATNGWTTGDLMYAIKDRPVTNSYDAVSVLIGVNNQYQGRTLDEYKTQFATILQRCIQLAAGKASHVFVISIPDYSVTPFAKGRNTAEIAAQIDTFNEANKMIAANYGVNYLYITDDSRKAANDPTLVASDGLHFSGREYSIWSSKLAPMLRTAL